MWRTSKTNRFTPQDITFLSNADLQTTQAHLMLAEPLIVLRSMVEICLRDDSRAIPLLLSEEISTRWRMYADSGQIAGEADSFDVGYYEYLEKAVLLAQAMNS